MSPKLSEAELYINKVIRIQLKPTLHNYDGLSINTTEERSELVDVFLIIHPRRHSSHSKVINFFNTVHLPLGSNEQKERIDDAPSNSVIRLLTETISDEYDSKSCAYTSKRDGIDTWQDPGVLS